MKERERHALYLIRGSWISLPPRSRLYFSSRDSFLPSSLAPTNGFHSQLLHFLLRWWWHFSFLTASVCVCALEEKIWCGSLFRHRIGYAGVQFASLGCFSTAVKVVSSSWGMREALATISNAFPILRRQKGEQWNFDFAMGGKYICRSD